MRCQDGRLVLWIWVVVMGCVSALLPEPVPITRTDTCEPEEIAVIVDTCEPGDLPDPEECR